jgi:hypothetical protein
MQGRLFQPSWKNSGRKSTSSYSSVPDNSPLNKGDSFDIQKY